MLFEGWQSVNGAGACLHGLLPQIVVAKALTHNAVPILWVKAILGEPQIEMNNSCCWGGTIDTSIYADLTPITFICALSTLLGEAKHLCWKIITNGTRAGVAAHNLLIKIQIDTSEETDVLLKKINTKLSTKDFLSTAESNRGNCSGALAVLYAAKGNGSVTAIESEISLEYKINHF